jgi:hypothetical protein
MNSKTVFAPWVFGCAIAKIEAAIRSLGRAPARLLITAAVNGKIDVRGETDGH